LSGRVKGICFNKKSTIVSIELPRRYLIKVLLNHRHAGWNRK
jgi:hypothetical protein